MDPEVAVIVDWPIPVTPGLGLQTMKFESQMPAQTYPAGETVTRAVLLLEKLTSATTVPPVEFSGVATSWTTWPVFSESDEGVRTI